MRRSNLLTAFALVVIGGIVLAFSAMPLGPFSQGKTDRLSGDETETAFLPERFGVPNSQQ
ncbi:hypothetical protein N7E02_25080 [Aliirhizobium terrae]|uniref:hypothetical protein n=1 Tax=Terrirhizobium terrae TaxID=2926709 RepID=UPI0025768D3C|nr:hypothetical protein [Rhizobium sp. CC-CFT758]WJH39925.1 hypothetical protein N7E02_25080 [Rhizobium sp. CC-CFT758]